MRMVTAGDATDSNLSVADDADTDKDEKLQKSQHRAQLQEARDDREKLLKQLAELETNGMAGLRKSRAGRMPMHALVMAGRQGESKGKAVPSDSESGSSTGGIVWREHKHRGAAAPGQFHPRWQLQRRRSLSFAGICTPCRKKKGRTRALLS